jgi:hypothetical protein
LDEETSSNFLEVKFFLPVHKLVFVQ